MRPSDERAVRRQGAGRAAPPRRRCSLVVPGSAAQKLAKAAAYGADEVVVDLEDAVVPDAKAQARVAVVQALRELDWGAATVSVRVNAPGTPWCHADLIALADAGPALRSVVVPKVECAGDLAFVERLLDGVEAAAGAGDRPLAVQALVETAAGVARVQEIAAAAPRLEALVVGYADLAVSLGRRAGGAADVRLWDPLREAVLLAARAHGLQAIDGPHLGTAVDDELRAAASRARDAGFDGKWAIHPGQIATLQELFTPCEAELAHARAVIAALAAAARTHGQGAVALEGRLLDEPMRLAALRVLAAAEGAA